ncbi:MAG TPA: 2,3-diphosphoglycerate synthetase [Actinomycetota bacterium]
MSQPSGAREVPRLRAIALVDGEHYPPVTLAALDSVRDRFDIVGAVMLGGGEKLRDGLRLADLPIVRGTSQRAALEDAIERFAPEAVIDISDAPVLDTVGRLLLVSVALARGVSYHGGDFVVRPPWRARRSTRPTIAVIGSGKRTGKTAVAAALARMLKAEGVRVVIVAMGRGGPAAPVVIRGDLERPTAETLLALSDAGEHAASDSYEDAVVAGVTTIGARRAGAGLAGGTVYDTVDQALEVAEAESPDLIILEGSGTALPPVSCDATVFVVGGAGPSSQVTAGLGPLRLLLADLVVATMVEEPVLSSETLAALTSQASELARDVPIVRTVFRPSPVGSVTGKRILFATTAPEAVGTALRRHLEEVHGATVVGVTHQLADRPKLSQELAEAEGTYDVLLTEVKAAAIDVAAQAARAAGAEIVFADNLPVATRGDLGTGFAHVHALAIERSGART